jgi:hypothetical protein
LFRSSTLLTLYGRAAELTDPLFAFTTAKSPQDVFVTFMGRTLLFASFSANLLWTPGATYNYLYGVGLK